MPEPKTVIAGWSAEQIRAACFAAPPGESRWGQPGAALVSGRLCALISGRRRQKDRRVEGLEDDLYQDVYEDIWKRLDLIWESFCARDRPACWSAFESFLQVSISNSLANAIRDLSRAGAARDEIPLTVEIPDPGSVLDTRHLVAGALGALAGDERDAVLDEQVRGRSIAETARRLGLGRDAVYRLRHRAFKRFRIEVIRLLGEEIVRASDPLRAVVRARCGDGHPCYAFKLDCKKARSPDQMALNSGGLSAAEASDGLARLVQAITEALEESGLIPTLDDCFWEARGPAAEDADHE